MSSTGLISKLICELREEQSILTSWMRIPKQGGSIRSIGVCIHLVMEPSHTWIGEKKMDFSFLQNMQHESGQMCTDLETRLVFRAFQTRWMPFQRESKWEEM